MYCIKVYNVLYTQDNIYRALHFFQIRSINLNPYITIKYLPLYRSCFPRK